MGVAVQCTTTVGGEDRGMGNSKSPACIPVPRSGWDTRDPASEYSQTKQNNWSWRQVEALGVAHQAYTWWLNCYTVPCF